MTLTAPLGLLAGLLAGPLVVWYLLRSRRQRLVVSSTLLWRDRDDASTAAVPWQRFRGDRTFWLTLLALLLGSIALAQPAVPVQAAVGSHTILVIDASGSMQAREGSTTRLELARREARGLVDQVGAGRTVSVVEAAGHGRVLLDAGDAGAGRAAIAEVSASDAGAGMADALTLTAALHRPGEDTVVHVITDRPLPAEALAVTPAGTLVDLVGADQPNLAVTGVQAESLPGGAARVYARAVNHGGLAVDADVTVTAAGQPRHTRQVRLGAHGAEDVLVEVDLGDVGGAPVLEVAIAPAGQDPMGEDVEDALPLDDRARVALAPGGGTRVLVAGGEDDLFLTAALASLPDVEVTTVEEVPTDLAHVDVLVVDGVAAPSTPTVPTLLVAPATTPEGIEVAGTLELPAITEVDVAGLAIAEAQGVTAPALRPVIAGPGGPLLLAGRLGAVPVVHLAFAPADSNLPLRVAWPVLVANTLSWLSGPPGDAPLTVGTDVAVPVPPGAPRVVLTSPSGDRVPVDASAPTASLDEVGVWEVGYPDGAPADAPRLLVVNADPAESDLAVEHRPDATGPADEETAAPLTPGAAVEPAAAAADPAADGRLQLGRWFLLAAGAVLAVEALLVSRARPA